MIEVKTWIIILIFITPAYAIKESLKEC